MSTFFLYIVTQQELKRLREAYRKACFGQSMSLDVFIREVIGTGVPHAVAEVGITKHTLWLDPNWIDRS